MLQSINRPCKLSLERPIIEGVATVIGGTALKKRRRNRPWVRIPLLLVGIYLGLCFALALSYVGPKRWDSARPKGLTATAFGGLDYPLNALASPGATKLKPSTPAIVIFAHGFGGRAGEWVNEMNALEEHDVPSLAIHMAAHGESSAVRVGFGPRESAEIIAAVRAVREQTSQQTRIIVVGRSLGGSAAWMAAGTYPDEIDGLMTEAAFAELAPATDNFLDGLMPKGAVVLKPVSWAISALTGVRPSMVRPIDLAANYANRPAIIAHSKQDALVPFNHAERLAETTGAELWVVEDSAHAQLASDQPDLFVAKIKKLVRLASQSLVPSSPNGTR